MIMFIIQNLLLGPLLTVDFLLNVSKKIFSEFLDQSDSNLGPLSRRSVLNFWHHHVSLLHHLHEEDPGIHAIHGKYRITGGWNGGSAFFSTFC